MAVFKFSMDGKKYHSTFFYSYKVATLNKETLLTGSFGSGGVSLGLHDGEERAKPVTGS